MTLASSEMLLSPSDRRFVARASAGLKPCGYGFLFAIAIAATLSAQRAAPIVVKPLKPDVYVAEGGGSNSGIVIGPNGVVVIDAKGTPEDGRALVAEISKLTPKPITHVIFTHADLDHIGGLPGFPAGVTI